MHDSEHQRTLGLANQHRDDLDRFFRIPTRAVQDRDASIDCRIDGRRYLVIFRRIDEKMHGTVQPRHEPVYGCRIGDRHAHTVHHTFDLEYRLVTALLQHRFGQRQEESRGDDENIADQHDITERDIPIMIDDHRDDIRTAG